MKNTTKKLYTIVEPVIILKDPELVLKNFAQ